MQQTKFVKTKVGGAKCLPLIRFRYNRSWT